ncbi:MAG: methyltransferase domain-containing protein [bacterium]|nr:methyltransferase domain-containing protein [bacterium]
MGYNFDPISRWYDNFFNQIYFRIIHRMGLAFIKDHLRAGQKFLDIGCGTGNWLLLLKKQFPLSLYSIDDSRGMMEAAKDKLPELQGFIGKAENLPFGNESFDFISIIEAFHHLEDQRKALSEAQRVLRGGGYIFLLDPVLEWPLQYLWKAAKILPFERESTFFRLKDLTSLFEQSGFRVLKSRAKLGNAWILAQK